MESNAKDFKFNDKDNNEINEDLINILCFQIKNSQKMVDLLKRSGKDESLDSAPLGNLKDHLAGLGFSKSESDEICKNFAHSQ